MVFGLCCEGNSQQDSRLLFDPNNIMVTPGNARESSTSLQAAFSAVEQFRQQRVASSDCVAD